MILKVRATLVAEWFVVKIQLGNRRTTMRTMRSTYENVDPNGILASKDKSCTFTTKFILNVQMILCIRVSISLQLSILSFS